MLIGYKPSLDRTVLVVSGIPNQLLLYKQELGDEGFRVYTAADQFEAIRQCIDPTHPRPDAVVIPSRNIKGGIETLERYLVNMPIKPKIIVHTSDLDPANSHNGCPITEYVGAYVGKSSATANIIDAIYKVFSLPRNKP